MFCWLLSSVVCFSLKKRIPSIHVYSKKLLYFPPKFQGFGGRVETLTILKNNFMNRYKKINIYVYKIRNSVYYSNSVTFS